MKKNKLLGITFFILMLLCIVVSFEHDTSPAIIDIIFVKIGLKPWSDPEYNSGTHYAIFFTLPILIVSIYLTKYYLKDIYPKLTKNLLLVLLAFVCFIYPLLYDATYKVVKTHSSGVNCIEYKSKSSVCKVSVYNGKYIKYDATIVLKNYSKKDVSFYIKLIPNRYIAKEIGSKKTIDAIYLEKNIPKKFKIKANTITPISATFLGLNKENFSELNGTMNGFDIIIFDKTKKKVFSTRYIK